MSTVKPFGDINSATILIIGHDPRLQRSQASRGTPFTAPSGSATRAPTAAHSRRLAGRGPATSGGTLSRSPRVRDPRRRTGERQRCHQQPGPST
jgi:uracil-DNA glycosylase